ncbi:MAG: DNA topoisomerase 3, partial [Rubrobacteraceae bacterium]
PSVGRDVARVLPGPFAKHEGYLEASDHIITWAVGHLVQLAEPDEYDARFKKWRMADLPILPDEFKLVVRDERSRKQMTVITRLLGRDDVEDVVNACDAGREGELIFAYVYEKAGGKQPVKRLWLNSMTMQAMREAFAHLRDGAELAKLEAAARSRSEADWIVGMNATRAATIRLRSSFDGAVSLGRVQTPTLAILTRREEEIRAFKPEKYWLVDAKFATDDDRRYEGRFHAGAQPRLKTSAEADAIVAAVRGKRGEITKLDKSKRTERAPLLFDLTSLQREANTRFGFSARRTLAAAQRCYEEHKVLTYPRTSSRYLTSDMVPEFKEIAGRVGRRPEYREAASYVQSLDLLPLGRVVDDAKVGDHHAIIPTNSDHALEKMNDDDRRVYDLVARRFLAVFFPAARFENTTVVTEVRGETFLSKGRVVLEAGWRALYPDGVGGKKEKEPPVLPPIEVGQEWRVAKVGVKEGETKPPPRYSESALLGAMETAGKFVEDEELRQAMKESGLGTPATRAAIIERLIKVGYVEREKKALVPTSKGRALISLLRESPLSSPELTGQWERRLAEMERGAERRLDFMADIGSFTTSLVEGVRAMEGEKLASRSREPLGACPKCGSPVVETQKAYGCSAWKTSGCDFAIWKQVSGKRLSEGLAKQLLARGRTGQLKGFRSKAGKPYSAALKLDGDHKVRLEFGERN